MKRLFWTLLVALTAVSFVGCEELEQLKDELENNQNSNEEGEEGEGGQEGEENEGGEGGSENGDEDQEGEENEGGEGGSEGESEVLQPSDQKTKISDVGQKLMEKLPADEWEKYNTLAQSFAESDYVSGDYDWGTAEDWFEEKFEESYKEESTETFKDETITFDNSWEILILMSNYTAHFDCTENGLVIKDYNGGTKVTFSLDGNDYEAEITTEGKVTEAIFGLESYSESKGYDYYDDNGNPVAENTHQIYKDKITFTVGVPEIINVYLKENGTHLLDVEVKFTTDFTKEGIDITTDSFNVSASVSFNGFDVIIEDVAYNAATGKAKYQTSINKNGENLISTSASADVKIKWEEDTWEDEWYSEWEDRTYYDKYIHTYVVLEKAQDIKAELDILGEIQARGTCSDAKEAAESIYAMWDALNSGDTANETDARRHLNNFNSKIDIAIYYDGGTNKQASIEFDLACEEYDGWEYWYTIPIIVFNDGSKYKVEEFFTEDAFEELIKCFEEFLDSYDEVIGFSKEVEVDHNTNY